MKIQQVTIPVLCQKINGVTPPGWRYLVIQKVPSFHVKAPGELNHPQLSTKLRDDAAGVCLPASACTAATKAATTEATEASTTTAKASPAGGEITIFASVTSKHTRKHHGGEKIYSAAFSTHVVVIVPAIFDQS